MAAAGPCPTLSGRCVVANNVLCRSICTPLARCTRRWGAAGVNRRAAGSSPERGVQRKASGRGLFSLTVAGLGLRRVSLGIYGTSESPRFAERSRIRAIASADRSPRRGWGPKVSPRSQTLWALWLTRCRGERGVRFGPCAAPRPFRVFRGRRPAPDAGPIPASGAKPSAKRTPARMHVPLHGGCARARHRAHGRSVHPHPPNCLA